MYENEATTVTHEAENEAEAVKFGLNIPANQTSKRGKAMSLKKFDKQYGNPRRYGSSELIRGFVKKVRFEPGTKD